MAVCGFCMFLVALIALWLRSIFGRENEKWTDEDSEENRKQEEEGLIIGGDSVAKARLGNLS